MNKITKNKLFFGIIFFGLVTNLLVLFDIKFFYFRAIFSSIFLTILPGLLLIAILKIKNINFWEYLVYTIGSSIAFIMFAGLAVNWVLPWLRITDRPLSLTPLLISFDIFLTIFWYIAYIRNKEISLNIELPKLDWLNKVFFITPVIFSLLSILGAITLNNGGPNYFTMIMLGGIAVYVFPVVLLRKKLNDNIYPWSIFMISISLLLMYSLRSWYISGWDNHLEFYVFQLTKINQYWKMANFANPYNGCISITILPTVLSLFSKLGDELLIKLISSLFFSFVPVVLYLTSKKYVSPPLAYLASFFFVSQWMFMNQYPFLAREQIALLFLSLVIYTLLNSEIELFTKNLLLFLFSFSIVISHYTTTYIALFLFINSFVLVYILKGVSKVKSLLLHKDVVIKKINLSGRFIMIFVLFAFFWNVQITDSAINIINFIKDNIITINLSLLELKKNETNWNLWKIGITDEDIKIKLNQYVEQAKIVAQTSSSAEKLFSPEIYEKYQITPKFKPYIRPINFTIWSIMHYFLIAITVLTFIFIFIGLITFLFHLDNTIVDQEYIIMAYIYASLLGLSLIMPAGIYNIGPTRIFQQTLILLALSCSIGAKSLFNKIHKMRYLEYISLILITYFLFCSNFAQEIVKGKTLMAESYNLTNRGLYYNIFYTQGSEVKSAKWLSNNRKEGYDIFADEVANLRLVSYGDITNAKIDILPSTIDKESYVYLDYNNKVKETGYISYLGKYALNYSYPIDFLDDNKNLIYNNGGSEIFK